MNNKKRDCFATLAMTSKRSFAFTLSEVLIVLAVLGVVAAMTIPDLVQDYREKALITALKKSYTIFSQAVDMATAENGTPNTWDIGTSSYSPESSLKLYNILKPYLRIVEDCGTSDGCFADNYGVLSSNTDFVYQPATTDSFAKGVLSSGASFAVFSYGYGLSGYGAYRAYMFVDVNGKSEPNKAGIDFFAFWITENGLIPMGQTRTGAGYYCVYNRNISTDGAGCTYWALKHENMDYLRKSGYYYGN